jgi:sugar phosphate isomerase/epimerase
MCYTRREFGRLALAGVPAMALGSSGSMLSALAQARPHSIIEGVPVGTITYSYRSMPDQSAEAVLRYVVESGISQIELMGGPVEQYAGAPSAPARGGGSGRGAAVAGARGGGGGAQEPVPAKMGSWNGEPCVLPQGRGAQPAGAAAGPRGAGPTPEQQAAQEHATRMRAWRTSVSMEPFKALRRMYNDAGVTIYAWKQLSTNMSDEEVEYVFNVADALGCTHTTLELPTDPAQLKRLGEFAVKKKIYAAYHTHLQGTMTAFDQAFALSTGNMANVDFGHWVAAGNIGGTPMQFLEKYHGRISSFHLKDRTRPENCALNLPWGRGETPIKEILQLVKRNRWQMPATIELEYAVPEGSNAVQEVRTCLDYCRSALTT